MLSEKKFSTFVDDFARFMRDLNKKQDERILGWIENHKRTFAEMSELQFEDLCRYQLCRETLLRKGRAWAIGQMPLHVFRAVDLSYRTWANLPAKDQKTLEDPKNKVAIKVRNQNISVPVENLLKNPAMVRKFIKPQWASPTPRAELLAPEKQNEPRPYTPVYLEFVKDEVDPDKSSGVLLTFRQGAGRFVCRMPVTKLLEIADRYQDRDRKEA
jgi:hypothetical protein